MFSQMFYYYITLSAAHKDRLTVKEKFSEKKEKIFGTSEANKKFLDQASGAGVLLPWRLVQQWRRRLRR